MNMLSNKDLAQRQHYRDALDEICSQYPFYNEHPEAENVTATTSPLRVVARLFSALRLNREGRESCQIDIADLEDITEDEFALVGWYRSVVLSPPGTQLPAFPKGPQPFPICATASVSTEEVALESLGTLHSSPVVVRLSTGPSPSPPPSRPLPPLPDNHHSPTSDNTLNHNGPFLLTSELAVDKLPSDPSFYFPSNPISRSATGTGRVTLPAKETLSNYTHVFQLKVTPPTPTTSPSRTTHHLTISSDDSRADSLTIQCLTTPITRAQPEPPAIHVPLYSSLVEIPLPPSPPTELKSKAIPPPPRKQRVIFHLVRHAEATHNLSRDFWTELDPPLTLHGRLECNDLSTRFPNQSSINLVLASPMARTLDTALVSFTPVLERGLKVIAWSDLREWGNMPCNTGQTLADLMEHVECGMQVDLRLLEHGWEYNAETGDSKREMRVERVKKALFELGEAVLNGGAWKGFVFQPHVGKGNVEIVVVSHGGFLSTLIGEARQCFYNSQYRSFRFLSRERMERLEGNLSIDKYALFETRESRMRLHTPIPKPETPKPPIIALWPPTLSPSLQLNSNESEIPNLSINSEWIFPSSSVPETEDVNEATTQQPTADIPTVKHNTSTFLKFRASVPLVPAIDDVPELTNLTTSCQLGEEVPESLQNGRPGCGLFLPWYGS